MFAALKDFIFREYLAFSKREGEAPAEPNRVNPMSMNRPIRKRPAGGVHEERNKAVLVFATICTKDRRPWLANPAVHRLLRTVWSEAGDWLVGRYVVMPDHLHLFAAPSFQCKTSFNAWMQFWKSQFTKRFRREVPIEAHQSHLWQSLHWDRRLRSVESYDEKWDYVVHNPVRHNLVADVADWPFQGEIHELRF